jgi:hypothetical protein
MVAQANAALSARRARIGPGESGMTRAILACARADGEMNGADALTPHERI